MSLADHTRCDLCQRMGSEFVDRYWTCAQCAQTLVLWLEAERMMADLDMSVRSNAIGGSDSPAILGVDDMRTEWDVLAAKKGISQFSDERPPLHVFAGQVIEPALLEIYTYMTGRTVDRPRKTYRHPTLPCLIGTPDGLCPGELRGVEAKVVSHEQRNNWGGEADEIPDRVRVQCWHYMSVMEYPVWDVIALVGGTPRVYTLERDMEVERAMLERLYEWYRRFLVGNERPPFTGSKGERRWLEREFGKAKSADVRQATFDEIALLEQYAHVRRLQKQYTTERGKIESDIKAAIGDECEGLRYDAGRFTWRKAKDGKSTDFEAMAWALLTNFIKDQAERDKLVEQYTTTKAGVRRIWFRHDNEREEE
jgi:predicted phage-related endonuclease